MSDDLEQSSSIIENLPEQRIGGMRHTTDPLSLRNNPFAETLSRMGPGGINDLKKKHLRLDTVHGGDDSLIRSLEQKIARQDPNYLLSSDSKAKELSDRDIDDLPKHIQEQVNAERDRINDLQGVQQSPGAKAGGSGNDRLTELKSMDPKDRTEDQAKELSELEKLEKSPDAPEAKGSGGSGFAIKFPQAGLGNPLKAFGKDKIPAKQLESMRPLSNEVLANTAIANELVNRIEKATKLNDYAVQDVEERLTKIGLTPEAFENQLSEYQARREQYHNEIQNFHDKTDAERADLDLPQPPSPSPELQSAMSDFQLTDAMKTVQSTQKNLAAEMDPANFSPLQSAIENGTISAKSLKKVESAVTSGAGSLEKSSSSPSMMNGNSEDSYLTKLKDFMENFSMNFKLPSFNIGLGGGPARTAG